MIDEQFLSILCCPETKEDVSLASEDMIRLINERISAGTLKNRAGQPVTEPIEGGLIRSDRKYLYAIRQDIPVMIIDEGIPLDGLA